MSEENVFVDIILPLPLPDLFTYEVPDEYKSLVKKGKRVVVQFGKKKVYTGIIRNIHTNKPTEFKVKPIHTVLDNKRIINDIQFSFWEWISTYYVCTVGEVMKAALPSGLKLESETEIKPVKSFIELENRSDKEKQFINLLKQKQSLNIKTANEIFGQNHALKIIHSLLDKNDIVVKEELQKKYKPKTVSYIKLHSGITNNEQLQEMIEKCTKGLKQSDIVNIFLHKALSESAPEDEDIIAIHKFSIPKKILLEEAGASYSSIKSLVKKGFFQEYEKEIGRISYHVEAVKNPFVLHDAQAEALTEIRNKFKEKDTVLLHGVTSSGKTEIYIHLIDEYLKKGKQVLYLLPEIALTAQIITRLTRVFGEKVGIYHSKFNSAERVEIWNNVAKQSQNGDYENCQVILGVRSSVFLPFDNLGLIIIDEEHENTYKQFDPAPRYHARDSALVLARLHGAKTLMGTATPSIESFYNAKRGKYGLVNLEQRYKNIKLPEVVIVDTKKAQKRREMQSHFTKQLLAQMEKALSKKEQIILFQNRRGFAPYLQCQNCGWIPKCKFCDVSLTYHKQMNYAVCHYCSYSISVPAQCKSCGDTNIQTKGFGTEKLEDEIKIFFPHAATARMDLDTTRSKRAYHNLIHEFENRQIDVLIGTQMISKGLDFDNVSVVGIMNADAMLNFPDFRAYERAYQLMAQVSGRAGRKNKQGLVIIQTAMPKNKIIEYVVNNDYEKMFVLQINERREFNYPPFCRLIMLTLKHKKMYELDRCSILLADSLRKIFKQRVLGPEYPIINRIQNYYQKTILIKIEKQKSVAKAKQLLLNVIDKAKKHKGFSGIQFVIDVDPM